ncbi:MAG: helicase, partial [Actinobacteria bacterium]|nr:helicase [Actinomycetota bacterium]
VWEDPDRAARLAREYNHRFNALVLRDYDPEGTRLRLPGLALSFTPRDHQRAAVARMINEPAVGLFHEVGAGKTAEMVIGAMELRRLGMVTKPAVVVPNHMLEQFTREWLQLYPQARILAASSADLRGDARRTFVARAATNDWDAVILTRGAFERIGVRRDTAAEYLDREVAALRAALERMKEAGAGLTVKRLERIVVGQEEAIKKALDGPQEPGVSFEDTGIDYLVVDEMHDFKNLRTVSNIQDANIAGSKRATDLHMKIGYLRATHGERVITGATATPIANSVTEAHVMQRYLRPDLLEDAGVLEFDRWAATFGQLVTEVEMAPTGGGSYRQKTRFAKFGNVPEMLRTWHTFADVKTADDLHLPVPELAVRADGKRLPETVVITPTDALTDYVTELGERAERVHNRQVEPAEDNMLKISTDGRKAALDVRLVDRNAVLEVGVPAKVEVAADRIATIWNAHRDDVFVDVATGAESAPRGAVQLVFCDLGTPGDGWNVYQELRDQLVARGLPRDGVRFIHEAKTDVEKERLFAAARSGHVDVLIGSTQKMGVGTNVQARAVALHHLDCPWRPADIAQREGRIIRQGNQNPEVGIYRYVVEGSFDAYSWQTVERKAKFISQVMRGRLDVREIEDIGDNSLSYAEVKALASGDPLVLERAHAQSELARLERLSRSHTRAQDMLARVVESNTRKVARIDAQLPELRAVAARVTPTKGYAFHAVIDGQSVSTRADAADVLRGWGRTHQVRIGSWRSPSQDLPLGHFATLGGLQVEAIIGPRPAWDTPSDVLLRLDDAPGMPPMVVSLADLMGGESCRGLVTRLEHYVASVDKQITRLETQREELVNERGDAQARLGEPFTHTAALHAAQERVRSVDAR